jgi:hypothetical protein
MLVKKRMKNTIVISMSEKSSTGKCLPKTWLCLDPRWMT